MTIYLYGLKNRLSGQFERPVSEPYSSKDYFDFLAQSFASSEPDILRRYAEYDIYSLGSFDTKSGVIVSELDFIGSLEQLCLGYLSMKEKAKENGREQA